MTVKRFDYFNRYQEDSGGSIQGDVQLLSIGYVLIIIYVAIMLGKFTRLNIKVYTMMNEACAVGVFSLE